MILRWVHPKQLKADGKLKPSAFPLSQLGKLNSREAPSVVDARRISEAEKAVAHHRACKFCEYKRDEQPRMPGGCDCEYAEQGLRGGISSEGAVRAIAVPGAPAARPNPGSTPAYLCLRPDEHENNPGHALIDTTPALAAPLSEEACMKLQKMLIEIFCQVRPVSKIFQDIPLSCPK